MDWDKVLSWNYVKYSHLDIKTAGQYGELICLTIIGMSECHGTTVPWFHLHGIRHLSLLASLRGPEFVTRVYSGGWCLPFRGVLLLLGKFVRRTFEYMLWVCGREWNSRHFFWMIDDDYINYIFSWNLPWRGDDTYFVLRTEIYYSINSRNCISIVIPVYHLIQNCLESFRFIYRVCTQ